MKQNFESRDTVNPKRRALIKATLGVSSGIIAGPLLTAAAQHLPGKNREQPKDSFRIPSRFGLRQEKPGDIAWATQNARDFIAANGKKMKFNYATGLLKADIVQGSTKFTFTREAVKQGEVKEVRVILSDDLQTIFFCYISPDGKGGDVIMLHKTYDTENSNLEYDNKDLG